MLKTIDVIKLRAEYAPYDEMQAFDEGRRAYFATGCVANPYEDARGQAFDRGMEYAMRVARIIRGD
jgi:hypothetical protein